MMADKKPLMLKDFLELDSIADSASGFRCAPRRPPDAATMRCLLEADLAGARGGLLRSRSKRAFNKFSAVLAALKLLPASSKKLRRSFSRRRGAGEDEQEEEQGTRQRRMVRVRDIVRLGSFVERSASFEFLSPVVSSCSSWSDSDAGSASDFVRSSAGSSECGGSKKGSSPTASPCPKPRTKRAVSVAVAAEATAAMAALCQPESKETEVEGLECQSEEEKEQLSPVSVMDFPYEGEEDDEVDNEDEETATSASFKHSLASIERTRHELLQKIRRFECLADLDPVDLEQSFASAEELLESRHHVGSTHVQEEEELERRARELLKTLSATAHSHIEHLLLDFFIEGLSESIEQTPVGWTRRRRPAAANEEPQLMHVASEWVRGRRDEDEWQNGEALVGEMERKWRWSEVGEEEEVAAGVEDGVLGSLVEELVLDLLSIS